MDSMIRHRPHYVCAPAGANGSHLSWGHQVGGLHLLPGVIARTNQRSRLDMLEAHGEALAPKERELLGGDVSVDRNVLGRRAEILTKRENVDVHVAELAHRRQHFLCRFAHSQDDSGFRGNVRRVRLHVAKDMHYARVPSARATALVKSRHRLGIVIVDLGARIEYGADALLTSLKVGYQHLDRTSRNALVNLPDRFGKDVSAEIGEVVSID